MKRWKQSKAKGGWGVGGEELKYHSSCLWSITQQSPDNFEAKVIKILKGSSGQLTTATNLSSWMKIVKLTNKFFYQHLWIIDIKDNKRNSINYIISPK